MNKRKDDHIEYALQFYKENNTFIDMKLIHNSISEVNFNEVELKTKILGIDFKYPFYINAMTGGTEKTFEINKKLAEIASKTGIMLCFGSISPVIKDENLINEYKSIIDMYPDLIFSLNVGFDKKYENVEQIIKELKPEFLQVHLNTLQELLMPEGDRDFSNSKKNIKEFISKSDVPIIVKEVGFGMSKSTIESLIKLGVKSVDISGSGGTNFALIENLRRNDKLEYLNNWGISTLLSLLEVKKYSKDIDVLASGGIKNALDIVKCLILGANSVGLAGNILYNLKKNGVNRTIEYIESLKREITLIMVLLNARKINDLRGVEYVLVGDTYTIAKQREVI